MTRIIGHYSYNQNIHRCTDFIVEKYLFSFLVRQRIVVWGEGCVGGRILVRELVSNPMNRTCLVGTLASPLSTCINALVSVRVYTYTACSTICGWVVAPVDNEEMRSGLYGYEVQLVNHFLECLSRKHCFVGREFLKNSSFNID